MKKHLLLFSAMAVLVPSISSAQELKEGYLTWPDSQSLGTYVSQWNGGSGNITINGKEWEDEEFFTSRVKPRARFVNTATQVYPSRMAYDETAKTGTDKRLVYWVPIGDEARNGISTNALANGVFDQEVFNMWSYIDHYGDWTCPWGWTPGVFADVAHKNGVAVSGVASVPYGGISTGWSNAFTSLCGQSSDAVGKFLYYHGQDGLGYNSEFSSSSTTVTRLNNMHGGLMTYMADKNPLWEVMWYAGTQDNGSIGFDRGVSSASGGIFKYASMFLNYNWNNPGTISSSVEYAKSVNRNPFLIYAGMNMQGGEPRGGENYPILKDYQYSIGLWAGHSNNILWKNRQANGSSTTAKQSTYNHYNEMLFGNGKRNPAIKQTITTNRSHFPNENFAGMSSMMNARSAIDFNINNEPFITYFNLGNGQFFNWKGERQNNQQWYNIGIQDYLPTWRWWFAPAWMQTDVVEGTTHLTADFTWDDAYMGGSCLQIEGSSDTEYLHLFKTNITGVNSKTLTVRYKLLEGTGDVNLMVGSASSPADIKKVWQGMSLFTTETSVDVQDQSYREGADGWVTKEFKIGSTWGSSSNLPGQAVGIIGLEFKNAKNLKLLLGEISITKNTNMTTPSKPTLKLARVLVNSYKGVDAKMVWTMDGDAARKAGTPKYNSDVNTSVFNTWAQQEGCEPVKMGATTSWAAFVFQAQTQKQGSSKMRFGVSAVSIDFKSESEIAWSEYLELPNYDVLADISVNKSVIKPEEDFTMSFLDSEMPSGTWVLKNSDTGVQVWSGSGKSVTCPGLSDVGAYDLELTYTDASGATVTKTYPRYIPISSTAVGALPEIYSLAIDGETVTEESADVEIALGSPSKKFSYTGRYADGKSSRGVDLAENWFGLPVSNVGIQANKSFSVAAWIRIDQLPEGRSNFITIEDRTNDNWPFNNWGWFWSRINEDGKFLYDGVDTAWGGRTKGTGTEDYRVYYRYDDAKVDVGTWSHVAVVFEYNATGGFRMHFYINGKKQKVSAWINTHKGSFEGLVGSETGPWTELERGFNQSFTIGQGSDTYEPDFTDKSSWPLKNTMWIAFGGSAPNVAAIKGSLDDFQVWGKAMTDEDVKLSMDGLDKNNLPADVLGYWDFESEPGSDDGFTGYAGSNATYSSPKAYWYDMPSEGENDNQRMTAKPPYLSGCPFLTGDAYPIVTKPTWVTRANAEGDGNGEAGTADIAFTRVNDYTVDLKLENGHGSVTKSYPVVKVTPAPAGIDGVAADGGEIKTYTVDDALFVDFAEAGDYKVMVFNTAGMLAAEKELSAVGGQTATIKLGTPGIYMVKVVKDGRDLRTVKVVRK